MTAEVKALRYTMVCALQGKMGHCIIRRTRESKQPNGTKISCVPPKKMIPYIVVLPERELDLLKGVFGVISTETMKLSSMRGGTGSVEMHMEVRTTSLHCMNFY